MRCLAPLFVALVFAGCPSPIEAPPCSSDTDCTRGSYCRADDRCGSDCVLNADCLASHGASSICNERGMCSGAPLDAGPGEDAGPAEDTGAESDTPPPDAFVPVDAGPTPPTNQADLLFVIDDSSSMAGEQTLLLTALPLLVRTLATGDLDGDGSSDRPPVVSLHVGVVTSDMGAGDLPGGTTLPSCTAGAGDDGILRRTSTLSGCNPTWPAVFDFMAGTDDVAAYVADVRCVAEAGTRGCGFEQQLEAALKAVSPNVATEWVAPGFVAPVFETSTGHATTDNAGFVRTESVLAIVEVTDEEDCSVPDHALFHDVPPFNTTDLNLRCFTYPEELQPVQRFVDGFLQLRARPSRLVFSGIVGVPTDRTGDDVADYDAALLDPRMIETPIGTPPNRLEPSCTTADGGAAYPARRFVGVARGLDALGARTTLQSICATNFEPAMEAIAREIFAACDGG